MTTEKPGETAETQPAGLVTCEAELPDEPHHAEPHTQDDDCVNPVAVAPIEPEVVDEDRPLIDVLDEDGELKPPSVLKRELKTGLNRLGQKIVASARQAGHEAAAETITRIFTGLDAAGEGASGKRPKEKDLRDK